jgi:acyl-CoA thioester hydrolase
VVYHANYLRFFERARTEWLRSLDYDAQALMRDHGLAFTLRRIEVDYLKPAHMDDLVNVSVVPSVMKRVYFVLDQVASVGGEPIARARVQVACVSATTFEPQLLPDILRTKFGAAL